MAKTRFFRVAVEGATATDGRIVEREMILDSVANFNRETYGVRINMEHIRGLSADGPFGAFGDVLALKSEEVDIEIGGKKEKRLALFAELDPTDELVEINRRRQKIYTSCEFAPNFAGTGKYGLVGLAATDNPASLGTDALSFTAFKPMFDARKTAPENFFSAAEEGTLEFDPAVVPPTDAVSGAFASMKAFFDRFTAPASPAADPVAPAAPTPPAPANDNFTQVQEGLGLVAASLTALSSKLDTDIGAIRTEFGTLKTQLENTEQPGFSRKPATGGNGGIVTDC